MEMIKKGRVGLITGGARGIGYAAARNLAGEGASLALVDINSDRVKESARRLSDETGVAVIGIAADISSESDVQRMVREATDRFGRIDLFLNSAAILSDNLFLESTPEQWDRMLKVCLYGPMLCLRNILPGMVERKYGRVVCMASDSARYGQSRLSYYAAAKAGVIGLVKSVAQEVGGAGITMNVIAPGATNTELRQEREESMRDGDGRGEISAPRPDGSANVSDPSPRRAGGHCRHDHVSSQRSGFVGDGPDHQREWRLCDAVMRHGF